MFLFLKIASFPAANEAHIFFVPDFVLVLLPDLGESGNDYTVDHVHDEKQDGDVEDHISNPLEPEHEAAVVRSLASNVSDSSATSYTEVEV